MNTTKVIRAGLFLGTLTMSIAVSADMPPPSFDEWRAQNRSRSILAKLGCMNSGNVGIADKWFYLGLIALILTFVLVEPRNITRRNRVILNSLAAGTILCAVVNHYDWCDAVCVAIAIYLVCGNVLLMICAFEQSLEKHFTPRHVRVCLCIMAQLIASGMSMVDVGYRIWLDQIAESEANEWPVGISPAPNDRSVGTTEEREAYKQYLWSLSHCKKCGSSLDYDCGRYCPRCNPRPRKDWMIRHRVNQE